MGTQDMIQEALAKYQRYHQAAQQVLADQEEYVALHRWLVTTKQLFPNAFGSEADVPTPLSAPFIMPDVEKAKPSEPLTLKEIAQGAGHGLAAMQSFVHEMSLGARRKLNADALDRVAAILAKNMDKSVHFDEIVKIMQEDGWTGYPLDDKGSIALYNAMQAKARNLERFRNNGDNKWTLIASDIFS